MICSDSPGDRNFRQRVVVFKDGRVVSRVAGAGVDRCGVRIKIAALESRDRLCHEAPFALQMAIALFLLRGPVIL
jgi:hypothetical protein